MAGLAAAPNGLQRNRSVPEQAQLADVQRLWLGLGSLQQQLRQRNLRERCEVQYAHDGVQMTMAVQTRGARGVVFHSDRGSQFTAVAFTRQCAAVGIERSMGGVGNCYDNAMAESFFATLECELLQRVPFASRQEAEQQLFVFVEAFYNRKRRHSALGYLSPTEFEQAWHARQKAA